MQQPRFFPKIALIPLALTIGVTVSNGSLDKGFAQTTPTSPATVECTEAEIETYINRLGKGDTEAFDFLVSCNSQAVPALIQLLNHEDENVRIVSIAILGEIGEEATEAIPFLEDVLKDRRKENEDSRLVVVDALGKMGQGQNTEEVVPVLIAALKDPDSLIHSNVASALGQIGEAAVPALIVALKDQDSGIRYQVASALRQMGKEAKDAVPALIVALQDKEWQVRSEAASALGQIGEGAKDAVPALIAALKDPDSLIHYGAASALGQIGEDAVPALIVALKEQDSEVRSQAASALGQIGEGAKDAVPALIAALKDPDSLIHYGAASALGQIGEDAVPALIAALKDEDSRVRSLAASALGKIGQEAKEAVPELTVAARSDECIEIREAAIESLRQIAPDEVASLSTIAEASRICFPQIPPTPTPTPYPAPGIAEDTIRFKKANPPVMCRYPVVKAILSWKCPETNDNSPPSQSRDSSPPSPPPPRNSNRAK